MSIDQRISFGRFSFCVLILIILLSGNLNAQVAKWVIKPEYDGIEVVSNGVLKLENSGDFGLSKYNGQTIVNCEYDAIAPFKDGFAVLVKDGFAVASVDTKGRIVEFPRGLAIDMDYPYYSEGLLAVKKDGKWGYLNEDGQFVIDCKYRSALPFFDGLAAVSDADGYFFHITKNNQVSFLRDGFNDDDLMFVTSFTKSTGKDYISIVVNSRGNAYSRNAYGAKTNDLVLSNVKFDFKSRLIYSKLYTLKFDAAWRLLEIIDNKTKRNKKIGEINDLDSVRPSLDNTMLSAYKDANGKEGLKYNNRACLPGQFDLSIILNSTHAVVSLGGRYGLVNIRPEESFSFEFDNTMFVFNHHDYQTIRSKIILPPALSGSNLEISSIVPKTGNIMNIQNTDSAITFDYLPDEVKDSFNETFTFNYKIDGINYLPCNKSVSIGHKPSFQVVTPDLVRLDDGNNGNFRITIINKSEESSDECSIYVNNKLLKTQVFNPEQSINISVTLPVDIEDEDVVAKYINVRIEEGGCPDYSVKKKISFERYYNN